VKASVLGGGRVMRVTAGTWGAVALVVVVLVALVLGR